ncbi:MAG: response regulator [Desulfatibacillum sp.]|nr:response regulator [Desulfatibacillum sp.]
MSLKQYVVLVADDERVVREGCRRILEAEGYQVLIAKDGAEAMGVLEANPVDLVLADLKMPGIGGLELLAWIKKNHPGLPAIVITGHGSRQLESQCEEAGALGLISKPFMTKEVVDAVKRAL